MKHICFKFICVIMVALIPLSSVMAQTPNSRESTTRKVDAKWVPKEKVKKVKVKEEKAKKEKVKEEKVKPPKERTIYAPVTEGWYNAVRLQYGLLISAGAHYQGEYRFNKWFGLGAGVGYEYYFESFNGSLHNIPLYANVRFYFLGEKRVNPFIGISQGIDIAYYRVLPAYFPLYGGNGNNFLMSYSTTPNKWIVGDVLSLGTHTRMELGCNYRVNSKNSLRLSIEVGIIPIANGFCGFHSSFNIGYSF